MLWQIKLVWNYLQNIWTWNINYGLLYHYGDQDRLHRHEEIIEDIYENYFDNLPEEEKLSVQVAQATVDMIGSKNPSFDQGL